MPKTSFSRWSLKVKSQRTQKAFHNGWVCKLRETSLEKNLPGTVEEENASVISKQIQKYYGGYIRQVISIEDKQ